MGQAIGECSGGTGLSYPLVSVIIPTYNRASYVLDAIESVLAQTYSNIEIIVVDDGSTDNTMQALSVYIDKIKLHIQANQGVSAARNNGIKHAAGELIAFLDSDDLFYPTKIAKAVDYFSRHPEVIMSYTWWDKLDRADNKTTIKPTTSAYTLHDLLQSCLIATPTVIVRREAIIKAGLFNIHLSLAEDLDYWCRLAMVGKVGFVPEPLTLVRLHADNTLKDPTLVFNSISQVIEGVFSQPRPHLKTKNYYLAYMLFNTIYRRYFVAADFPQARAAVWRSLELYPMFIITRLPRWVLQLVLATHWGKKSFGICKSLIPKIYNRLYAD